MPQPRVHVLVINWNGREHLDACFRSLIASPYENARFVLVDNASEDDSIAFVQAAFGGDPRVDILALPENRGWSGGNNAGIEQALAENADYVFLLNNDTAVAPDCLSTLVSAAECEPRIGALTPKITLFDHPDILNSVGLACSQIGACWDIGLGRLDLPRWNEPKRVIGACGAAALFRCSTLRETGLLPEDFDIYLDDLDLCLRVWQAGYEVWSCPAATVRHKFSATMGEGERFRRKYFLNVRNRMRIIRRNFPASKVLGIAPAMLYGETRAIGRALLDGQPWMAATHLRAWRDAATYRPADGRGPNHGECRFWPLVTRSPLFFPGTQFPDENGWYAETRIRGVPCRSFARTATYHHGGGRLRISLLGRYDSLGMGQVRIDAGGVPIARLMGVHDDSCIIDAPPGPLTVTGKRIFDACLTGEGVDCGGWMAFEPLPDR